MRTLMALTLAALLIACGPTSTAPNTFGLTGTWHFSENISNALDRNVALNSQRAVLEASCSSTSTVSFRTSAVSSSPSDSSFTGNGSNRTLVCTQNGSVVINLTGLRSVVGGGRINGTGFSFFMDNGVCNYTGTLSGSPPNSLSGSENCTLTVSGTQYIFLGTWQAAR